MAEIDRVKGLLREAVADDVAEDIVAIGWFHREDSGNDSLAHGPRLLRRVFAKRDDHPADHLGSRNVLVLTPTRVLVYAGKAEAPLVRVTKRVGAWPIAGVTATAKNHTAESYMQNSGGTVRTRMLRATLTFSDDTAPLTMDFQRDQLGKECVAAVQAACDR
ncbi:MAG: hypothetical protein QOI15_1796 [Pseudonocardiales bacterium]|nr:hypothetical protein [Pseudonocardiales bacterium]MEA2170218.1 hypothetical protein [Solirubrobacteraceae bacterium]